MVLKKKIMSLGIACTNLLATMASASFTPSNTNLPTEAYGVVRSVLGLARAGGVVIAIAMLTYAGFKYLTAGAGEKAKAKDMFVPLAIGAGLVVLAPFLGTWAWDAIAGATSK